LNEEVSFLKEANEVFERRELDTSLVQNEELQQAHERLAATEEKLRLCKERVEGLGDIKKALLQEEEAHSASVEECHRLENELNAIQPLKIELEKYKETQSQLAVCKDAMKELVRISEHEKQKYEDMAEKAAAHKEEAEDLRRQLGEKEQSTELCTRYVTVENLSFKAHSSSTNTLIYILLHTLLQ